MQILSKTIITDDHVQTYDTMIVNGASTTRTATTTTIAAATSTRKHKINEKERTKST